MFWRSLLAGFSPLIHWEVWIGAVLYAVCVVGFLVIVGWTQREKASGAERGAGCLLMALGGPLLQGILISLLVMILLPLLLAGQAPNWGSIPSLLLPSVIAGVVAAVLFFLLSLAPILGSLISENQAATVFVQGAIVFRLIAGSTIGRIAEARGMAANVFPGWLESLGYLFLSLFVGWILVLLLGALRVGTGTLMEKMSRGRYVSPEVDEDWLMILGLIPASQVIAGLMVLMMYIQFVKLKLGG